MNVLISYAAILQQTNDVGRHNQLPSGMYLPKTDNYCKNVGYYLSGGDNLCFTTNSKCVFPLFAFRTLNSSHTFF